MTAPMHGPIRDEAATPPGLEPGYMPATRSEPTAMHWATAYRLRPTLNYKENTMIDNNRLVIPDSQLPAPVSALGHLDLLPLSLIHI